MSDDGPKEIYAHTGFNRSRNSTGKDKPMSKPKIEPNRQLGWNAANVAMATKMLDQVYLDDGHDQAEITRAKQILTHQSKKLSARLLDIPDDDPTKATIQ